MNWSDGDDHPKKGRTGDGRMQREGRADWQAYAITLREEEEGCSSSFSKIYGFARAVKGMKKRKRYGEREREKKTKWR